MKTTLYQPTPEDRGRWRIGGIRAFDEEIKRYNRIIAGFKKTLVSFRAAAATLEKDENTICVVKAVDLGGL